jgi:hypothetical protein
VDAAGTRFAPAPVALAIVEVVVAVTSRDGIITSQEHLKPTTLVDVLRALLEDLSP